MATGLSTQLTRQIGEHLVAAKLGRMGFIAAPFAGNVPEFDLIAADPRGFTIPIQVKAINGPSWQYKADAFLEIEIVDGFQHVRGRRALLNPSLVCIYILLSEQDEKDEFYIFLLRDLQEYTFAKYKSRRRPKNPESTHCAVWPKDLAEFRDNWDLIRQSFPAIPSSVQTNERVEPRAKRALKRHSVEFNGKLYSSPRKALDAAGLQSVKGRELRDRFKKAKNGIVEIRGKTFTVHRDA